MRGAAGAISECYGPRTFEVVEQAVSLVSAGLAEPAPYPAFAPVLVVRDNSVARTPGAADVERRTVPVTDISQSELAVVTSESVEHGQKLVQLRLLLDVIYPVVPDAERVMLGFSALEWPRVPEVRRQSVLRKFLTSFSVGYLGGCRRTLKRLTAWLEARLFVGRVPRLYPCSSGILC